jgi:glutaconate CoA-transferase subunit A
MTTRPGRKGKLQERDKVISLAEAASLVEDGTRIGFGGNIGLYRRPVGFAMELIRQGRRDLDVFGVINGIEADLLIGAGCVRSTNTSYVGFDELGQAPNFQRAAEAGTIEINEYGEWGVTAGFRAANMGIPYIPWITSRYTDVAAGLGLKEVECPYTGTPLLAVRALNLDAAVIHVQRCDRAGNTEIPTPLEYIYDVDALVAKSAERIIVCCEEIGAVDPNRVQLIGREVDAVVELPNGAWPGALHPLYPVDREHLIRSYLPAGRADEFQDYLDRYVFA